MKLSRYRGKQATRFFEKLKLAGSKKKKKKKYYSLTEYAQEHLYFRISRLEISKKECRLKPNQVHYAMTVKVLKCQVSERQSKCPVFYS